MDVKPKNWGGGTQETQGPLCHPSHGHSQGGWDELGWVQAESPSAREPDLS